MTERQVTRSDTVPQNVVIPLTGALSDKFSRKGVLVVAMALFGIAVVGAFGGVFCLFVLSASPTDQNEPAD